MGLQKSRFHAAPVENGKLRKFGATFRHGTVFVPKQCLFKKKSYGKGEPKSVNPDCVQKAYRLVRACKRPGFM